MVCTELASRDAARAEGPRDMTTTEVGRDVRSAVDDGLPSQPPVVRASSDEGLTRRNVA